MKHLKNLTSFAAVLFLTMACNAFKNPESSKSTIPLSTSGIVDNFAMLDHLGKFHELHRYSDSSAIVIISQGNSCPLGTEQVQTINELSGKFKTNNVTFFLMNSNPNEDRDNINKLMVDYKINLPVLLDSSQVAAETLGITNTAEAVIINPNGWKMTYRGPVNGLEKKIKSVLNKTISESLEASSQGCPIAFTQSNLSYKNNIASIIEKKCLNCHTEQGQFKPYFTDYQKFRGWRAMSLETILNTRMPPSSLDTYYGNFHHKLALTDNEKAALVRWIRADMPNDSEVDPLVAAAVKKETPATKNPFKKIYETSMNEEHYIPPGGEIEYQYKQLGGPLPYDLWIKGAHVKPTNPRLIHHMAIMAVNKPLKYYRAFEKKLTPEEEAKRNQNTDGSLPLYTRFSITKKEVKDASDIPRFQIWAAGKPQPFFMAKNTYTHFKKGSYLIMEAHYMGSGKPETDKTTIEFYGTRSKIPGSKPIHAKSLVTKKMSIPPGVKEYSITTHGWTPDKNIHLYGFMGHLHMRGKSVEVISTDKKGNTKIMLSIPNYYYGWQVGTAIAAKEPIPIKAGEEKIQIVCHYDNSAQNPYNPDPTKHIRFGQRHDTSEMCLFHISYTVDNE